jgi:ferredoxin
MAYRISEDCLSCGTCEPECPNAAIKEGDTIFVIDPAKCTECVGSYSSSKCVEICPIDAPKPDPVHVETKEQLQAKWQQLHPGP